MMNATPEQVWYHWFGYAIVAQDVCGAIIHKSEYGRIQSLYGWQIDHIIPVSRGGSNHITNLRPLHWRNNIAKDNNLDGQWQCAR